MAHNLLAEWIKRHKIDTGDWLLTDIHVPQQTDLGGVVSNAFGEHYLFGINRNVFQGTDASTVFRSNFSSMFEENTFYIVAGTDSGLLYQYVKAQGVPKGSRYLFVELPQILALLTNMDNIEKELVVASEEEWMQQALAMDMLDYAIQDRLILCRSLGVMHGHYQDYPPFLRRLREEFHVFVETQRVSLNSRPFTLRQIENLSENQIPATCLKEVFQGKTAVLLAGGPSLDEILPWVQQHRHDLLVIAVSRISHSLLQAGIQPDICVSVDPYPINMNVSREMLEFKDGTLLVNEFHLNPSLLSSWGGQKTFMGARYPWATPLQPENLPPALGSTVTNTAFSIAVETGVSQLILGGTDFCFSQEGYTHASGSAEHKLGPRPMYGNQRVRTNNDMMADTTNSFLNSARTIDAQAQDAMTRGCMTINPAPGAMSLQGVEHLPLEIIEIEPMEQSAQEIIAASLTANDSKIRSQLYKEELGEVDRVLAELRTIKELSNKALTYNRKLFDENEKASGFLNKSKLEHIEKQLKEKYADTTTFITHFGISRFVPILRHDEQHRDDLEENSRLYFQALVDTTAELIDILHQARRRITSRMEEEKAQPNIQYLLEQWKHDQQPGRAIQWAQHHENYVDQLPESQQQALHTFQNTFDETVQELSKEYISGIEQGVKLDGLTGKAREYFLCGDQEAQLNLLTSLKEHRDQEQAGVFIPLVEGYLAELRNEPTVAIEAYQKITEGPAHIDALMRLFELHTKAENLDSALSILKILSSISSVYSPMYADLLQATGDVDTAVEIYTDYLLATPEDLDTMMKLGKLYAQHGATDGVIMTMNYILDKDPDNHTAKAMLASLDQSQVNGE